MNLETYKEICRRLDKSKIPIKGLPIAKGYYNADRVLVSLDKTRTPRISKLMKWCDDAKLMFCWNFPSHNHYTDKIIVELRETYDAKISHLRKSLNENHQ